MAGWPDLASISTLKVAPSKLRLGGAFDFFHESGKPRAPNNDFCRNYSVISTRVCLFNHTRPLALSMTYNHLERNNRDCQSRPALLIRMFMYVHYYLNRMFHVEHCTYN